MQPSDTTELLVSLLLGWVTAVGGGPKEPWVAECDGVVGRAQSW